METTSGRATNESIAPAAKNERPSTIPPVVWLRNPSAGASNNSVPNRASTIDGVPASISIVDSATRASARGRANSLSHTAIAIPSGVATIIAIAATIIVPSSGSRNPPVWFSV